MKKVINPTEESVKIIIKGNPYEVGPKSSVKIQNDEHAEDWVRTHKFLELEDVEVKPSKEAKEAEKEAAKAAKEAEKEAAAEKKEAEDVAEKSAKNK